MDSMSISQSQSPWYSLSNSDRLNGGEEKSTAALKVPCERIFLVAINCVLCSSLLLIWLEKGASWQHAALLLREYLTSGGNYSVPLVRGAVVQVSEVWKGSEAERIFNLRTEWRILSQNNLIKHDFPSLFPETAFSPDMKGHQIFMKGLGAIVSMLTHAHTHTHHRHFPACKHMQTNMTTNMKTHTHAHTHIQTHWYLCFSVWASAGGPCVYKHKWGNCFAFILLQNTLTVMSN